VLRVASGVLQGSVYAFLITDSDMKISILLSDLADIQYGSYKENCADPIFLS